MDSPRRTNEERRRIEEHEKSISLKKLLDTLDRKEVRDELRSKEIFVSHVISALLDLRDRIIAEREAQTIEDTTKLRRDPKIGDVLQFKHLCDGWMNCGELDSREKLVHFVKEIRRPPEQWKGRWRIVDQDGVPILE